MPKQKTHKGAAKRFRLTRKGKVKRHRAGKSHLLSGKSSKRRRQLRKAAISPPMDEKKIRRLLGAG